MNPSQVDDKWRQLKGSFQEKWGKFTDDEFTSLAGNREKIIGALQQKYGHSKEQAQREFDAWYSTQKYSKVRAEGENA